MLSILTHKRRSFHRQIAYNTESYRVFTFVLELKKSAGSHLPADQNIQSIKVDYLRVILAPSASSFVLMSLASSLDAPCLRTFGAPSTTSLASLRPRPVTSRTTLITLTLFGPTSVSSTSNSVFSSSAAAPAPAAATTTPAAP